MSRYRDVAKCQIKFAHFSLRPRPAGPDGRLNVRAECGWTRCGWSEAKKRGRGQNDAVVTKDVVYFDEGVTGNTRNLDCNSWDVT